MAEGDAELQDLYRDVLLDYYRSSSHKGRVEPSDLASEGVNPVCGDTVRLTGRLDGAVLREVKIEGQGCVISQASAAMMVEALEGKSVEEAGRLAKDFKAWMTDREAPADRLQGDLEEGQALEGVRKFPVRIKCALLAWNTLLEGLDSRGGASGAARYEEKA